MSYFGRVSHAAYPHPQNLSETTDFVIIFIDDAQERVGSVNLIKSIWDWGIGGRERNNICGVVLLFFVFPLGAFIDINHGRVKLSYCQ
jgi:hypothetical protein